jgi:hypothetical protein
MSTPVTYVGQQYNVPAYQDTGYAQGSGNLSSYLIALATGSLTLSGGTFTLTADADFGANFGLKSIYYKSRNANVASTGIIRLGSAELICWRDNANANDLELTTNASDQLTFNGAVIASSTGALNGTTLTLTATSNQMVVGTTRTVTLTLPTPASASRTVTVPDLSGDYSVVGTIGSQSIAGVKTFSSQPVLSAGMANLTLTNTTNQLVLGTTNTVTISSTAPAASRVYTMPDVGGAADFIFTAGAQTITGAKTFASSALLLQEAGSTDVVTIAVAALAASRIYTVPDAGGAASFVMTAGTQTVSGAKTFDTQLIGKGTATNDNAAAGYIGEYTESVVASGAAVSSTGNGQYFDVTSISLTAGDWDVSGIVNLTPNGATVTQYVMGISITTGNSATGIEVFNSFPPTAAYDASGAIPSKRYSFSGTTTVYLKAFAAYSVATPKGYGRISARRVR